jgi:hypothetical protein
MAKRTKWTPELVGKMLAWKQENSASNIATAAHFKISSKSFQQTLNKYGKIKLGKLAAIHRKSAPTSVVFDVPEKKQALPTGSMAKMVAIMSVEAFSELIEKRGSQWQ